MRGQSALGLGFLFRFPLFVVVVVVVPVIVLILRRKWRQSVERSEEVRRLLVSASEESTRAELAREAYYYGANSTPSVRVSSPVYASVQSGSKPHYASVQSGSPSKPHYDPVQSGSPSKPQYQCAVCFRPTTTRCSKCKAARYCSGKCQIVHWRQGHKDECRPYVPVTQVNNVGGCFNKQGDHKDHSDSFDTEAKQNATSAQAKPPSTPTSFSAGVTFENPETVKSAHKTSVNTARKSTDSLDNIRKASAKSKSPSTHIGFSAGVTFENLETVKSAHKTPVNPARKSTDSLDNIQKTSAKSKSPSMPISFSAGVTSENLEKVKSAHKTPVNPAKKSTELFDNIQKTSNLSDEDAQSGTSSSSFWTDDGSNESSLSEPSTNSSINEPDDVAPVSVGETEHGQLAANHKTQVTSSNNINNGFHAAKAVDESNLGSKKSNDITDSPTGMVNLRDRSDGSDLPTAAKYSKVNEKSNDVCVNKSTAPDMSKPRDSVTSSPKASDTCLKTVTSRNVSHSTKPVVVIDDVNPRISTSSQSIEATRRVSKTSKSKAVDHLKPSKSSHQQSLEGGSDTTHNYSFKGLFPYEMFIKLYNCKHVELQPFGLKNCGNSCYANAVLQCLIYTPPLTTYLLEGLHSKACEKRGWCFTCELEGLVRKAKDGISPLSPIHILTHIENIGSNLGHGKEEDAHEFLRYVIDALQAVCIKESRKKSLNLFEEETTLIGLTFGGYLRSKIMCLKCGGKSEQHERMMDLTVEIEGGIRTLEEALNKFTCTEILDGENKYKCNRCKSYEKAKKKFTLLEAPNVLTIALKRFQSGKFGKINKSVKFPEILDMAPYVSGSSDKSPIYSLYGVVVHVDTMNAAFSGHYVCYVKNLQNRWFKFDDSVVKEVDLKHVLTKEAYMLLYSRCSPRAPRSIRSSIIHHHQHHHDSRKHKIPPPSFTSKSHPTAPWDACNYQPPHVRRISLEDECTSSDNSSFFSESCSCSTESTRSMEDHINLNSSDSDTSSTSSFPSPLYSKLARLYSSTGNREEDNNNKICRKLDCSCNSCRITNLDDRLGGRGTNPSLKPSVTVRRSTSRGKRE